MKGKKKNLGKIDGNELLIKQRVMLDNKTIPHKNKKKLKSKYKCRKSVKL